MKAKILIAATLCAASSFSSAYEYCSGKVQSITTRTSGEGTYVDLKLSDGAVSGKARIGGGDKYLDRLELTKKVDDNQAVQIELVLTAYVNSKTVFLELDTSGYNFNSCSDFDPGIPVRYVKIGAN